MTSHGGRGRSRGNDLVFTNPAANFDDDPDAEADLALGQAKYVKYVDQHTIDDSNAYVMQNAHPMDSFEEPKPQPRPRPRSKVNEGDDAFPYSDPYYKQTSPQPTARPSTSPRSQDYGRGRASERLAQPAPQEVRSGGQHNRSEPSARSAHPSQNKHYRPNEIRSAGNRSAETRSAGNRSVETRSTGSRSVESRSVGNRSNAELNIADSSALATQVEEARKASEMPCGLCSDSAYLQYWMDWLLAILFVIFLCAACAAAQQWALLGAVLFISVARALVGWAVRTRRFWKKQPIKAPTSATVKVALLFLIAFLCLCGYAAMVYLSVMNAI